MNNYLPRLPSTLATLKTSHIKDILQLNKNTNDIFLNEMAKQLPLGLRHFKFYNNAPLTSYSIETTVPISHWPAHLETLEKVASFGFNMSSITSIVDLPSTLTKLDIQINKPEWLDHLAAIILPASLKALKFRMLSITTSLHHVSTAWQIISKLRTLESLDVWMYVFEELTPDEWLACLPPNLKHLTCRYALFPKWRNYQLRLPASLETLTIHPRDQASVHGLSLLTRLRSLCFYSEVDDQDTPLGYGGYTMNQMSLLHYTSLETLQLRVASLFCNFGAFTRLIELDLTIAIVSDHLSCFEFPASLRHLTVRQTYHGSNPLSQVVSKLPPLLESFHDELNYSAWDLSLIQALPRRLKSLKLSLNLGFKDWEECIKAIPSSLEILDLDLIHSTSLPETTNNMFSLLPPRIHTLILHHCHFTLNALQACTAKQLARVRHLAIHNAKDVYCADTLEFVNGCPIWKPLAFRNKKKDFSYIKT